MRSDLTGAQIGGAASRRRGTPARGTARGSAAGRRPSRSASAGRSRRGRSRAAEALGDVVAGELDVQAAGVGAERAVHLEEAAHLVDDVVEAPGLVAVAAPRRCCRASGRRPRRPGARSRVTFSTSAGSTSRTWPRAHPGDERQPAGLVVGVEPLDQRERVVRRRGRAELDADRVADPGDEARRARRRAAGSAPRPRRSAPDTSYGRPVRESIRVSARS